MADGVTATPAAGDEHTHKEGEEAACATCGKAPPKKRSIQELWDEPFVGDEHRGKEGWWRDMNQMQPSGIDRYKHLKAIDEGKMVPDPDSRLGAYHATKGYPPGTVGNSVHRAIGGIYMGFGQFGEERIGRVFNSAEAAALFNDPVDSPSGLRMAEIEHEYWTKAKAEDPWSSGGHMGSAFKPGVRDVIQKGFSLLP